MKFEFLQPPLKSAILKGEVFRGLNVVSTRASRVLILQYIMKDIIGKICFVRPCLYDEFCCTGL